MTKESSDLYYIKDMPVPETPPPGTEPAPWGETAVVGQARPRVDAYDRVSGTALYPSDLQLPSMLYGAILRCPHPHARIRRIDLSAAASMPGVAAVLGPDSPEAALEWPWSGELRTRLLDRTCRFEGEAVAAVAAETPYQTADALRAIAVDYEVLPFVAEMEKALAADAPRVHPGGNRVKPAETYERGDVDRGFAEADAVRELTFTTACELHTPMELHGCVANWEGERLTLWESTQGVYAVQSRVAEILGLPLSQVRVINHYMGGGFGSKLRPGKYTILAALLARKAARPVKLFLTREETMLAAGNRPPARLTLKAGIKRDGRLTALECTGLATGGAYPGGGTALLDWLIRDLYLCANVRTELNDVYINAGQARPFRAPGHPQGAWALEQMIDVLAEAIGMDPVAVRLKNVPTFSQAREGNPPYTTTGLRQCLEEGARAFGWQEARRRAEESCDGHVRRGVGMGACVWIVGGGGPPATVVLKLFRDGSVNLNLGASDIGTGTKTVMAMVVAEELGVRPELIAIEHADTGTTQYATPSGGSKTVPTEAPAVRAATVEVKRQLLAMAAEELGTGTANLRFRGETIERRDDPSRAVRVTALDTLGKRGVVIGVGYRGPNPAGKVVNPFGAQFCEVEVNMRTGEVKVLRFLAAHDSGRVMNRLTYDNQVFGGIAMGIGFGLTEARLLDRGGSGKLLGKNWYDYKLPTMLDVPAEIASLPIELADSEANTTGAKGLGEPVTIPTAAAIANAVHHATGLRLTASPIQPAELCRQLAAARKEG